MISGLFTHRFRGVRIVNLWGMGVLLVLVVALYLMKTFAGSERADIASTQRQIIDEQRRISLLRAEVAFLERPERIERLAEKSLNEQPLSGKQETSLEGLQTLAPPPASSAPGATTP